MVLKANQETPIAKKRGGWFGVIRENTCCYQY
jgi:hypothetical protein